MFYAAVCPRCNTGLYGDRSQYYHPDSECEQFQRIRQEHKIPKGTRTDQEDLLKFNKKRKKSK